MNKLFDLLPIDSPLHHAYLIVGEPAKVTTELKNWLEQRWGVGFTSSANPDFSLREFSTWGVDESRELKAFNSRRPISWPVKIVMVVPKIITLEAQNSLLKTLEEPAADTHFFIITRRLGEYLPTVISRCQVIKMEPGMFAEDLVALTTDWLSVDIARRWEINKNILKQQEDNSRSGLNWLNCLLDVYWNKVSDLPDKKALAGAQALADAVSYANQRGSSLRVILEHLSGVVPTA